VKRPDAPSQWVVLPPAYPVIAREI